MSAERPDSHESELSETRDEVTEPPLYRVLIHNDDFTPKAFVVEVLVKIFNKPMDEAQVIMWHPHENGTGLCGIYPLEVADNQGQHGVLPALARQKRRVIWITCQ